MPAGETCRPKKGYQKHLTGDPAMDERIQEAADSCPVEVIQLEQD